MALDARPLRGPRDARRSQLLVPIEAALGGVVALENGRFYVLLGDGKMEAPLVAEGLRKLAVLAHLVVNGSLSENAFLFWDEPEANLNPKLARLVSEMILALGDWGVQVFLASHDYALASELSLASERRLSDLMLPAAVFFGLARGDSGGVSVEQSSRLLGLSQNPILEALSSLHDRELQADG
ncbi:MAG: AAA family ATPase [Polyangiaceae bacterium]